MAVHIRPRFHHGNDRFQIRLFRKNRHFQVGAFAAAGFAAAPKIKAVGQITLRCQRLCVLTAVAVGTAKAMGINHRRTRPLGLHRLVKQAEYLLAFIFSVQFLSFYGVTSGRNAVRYLRTGAAEQLLVILTPSAQAAVFPGTYPPKRTVYQFGGEAGFDGEQVTVPPCPAGFYTLA